MKEIITKIGNSRIFSLMKVLVFIAVCAVIGATAAYIHHESDPTEVAVEYFKVFMKQDYKGIKKLIDVPNDSYLDEKALGAIIADQKKDLNVDQYEVKEPTKENGKNLVVIRCSNKETGKKMDFKIYLNAYRKGFSLKPSYKVDFSKYYVNDCEISIPDGDTLQLNGTDVPEEMVADTKDGMKRYEFPTILKGEYSICSQNQYGVFEKKIQVKENQSKTNLTKLTYGAKSNYRAKVEEAYQGMFQQYYASVRKKGSGEKDYLAFFEKSARKKAKKAVQSTVTMIFDEEHREKYGLSNVDISDLKTTITYNKKEQQFDVVSTYQMKYDCVTATSLINSYTESYSGSSSVTMKASISVKQKNFKIKDIIVKNKKSKKKK
ncbi:MAG: hypothetical protein K6G64_07170 [Eubacterium sp.]|nr:hypothetical protein [Eubacterium sp.]